MATTIITKNGSGAPVAGDLVQGELAVDLTNKTLYSKDSSGNVFKVGDTGGGSPGTFTDLVATNSFTSPGIDDNATSTALTVTNSGIAATLTTAAQPNITSVGTLTGFTSTGIDDNATSTAITIDANENVGVGQTNPSFSMDILAAANSQLRLDGASASNTTMIMDYNQSGATDRIRLLNIAGDMAFATNNNQTRMTIDKAGNVGIGTSDPDVNLEIYGGASGPASSRLRSGSQVMTNTINTGSGCTWQVNKFVPMGWIIDSNAYTWSVDGGSSEAMTITSAGNVGIGLDNPNSSYVAKFLHVEDATSAGYVSESSTGKWSTYANTSGGYTVRNETTGSVALAISASGTTTVLGGFEAAQAGAGTGAFAAGTSAGLTSQGTNGVAIGNSAGKENQSSNTVAIGVNAATTSQGNNSVAVGRSAGNDSQASNAVAVGYNAGQSNQSSNCVAIGNGAANSGQGANSVAIGTLAGLTNQGANGIIINSTGGAENATQANHILLKSSAAGYMYYNGSTSWEFAGGNVTIPNDNLLVGRSDVNFGGGSIGSILRSSGRGLFENTGDATLAINRKDGTTYANIIQFYRGNSLAGTIQAQSGAAPQFAANSDRRLKDNIIDH